MSEALIFFVGNRNPAISENLVDEADVPIDLTGKTVKFKARELGASALLVDANAEIVGAPTLGTVAYDWTAADIAVGPPEGILYAPRRALVWWEVTTIAGGKKQDMNEATIEVRAHAPITGSYVELEEFKATAQLTGQTYADTEIREALVSASRAIDEVAGQFFYLDPDDQQVRYYTAEFADHLRIDPLTDFTSLLTDPGNDGTFEETWTRDTDFVLEPFNALADGKPFNTIRILSGGSYAWPAYSNRIKLTGQFGWPATPAAVKTYTRVIAARLVKIMREMPHGVAAIGGDGMAVRIARQIPDMELHLSSVSRKRLLV